MTVSATATSRTLRAAPELPKTGVGDVATATALGIALTATEAAVYGASRKRGAGAQPGGRAHAGSAVG